MKSDERHKLKGNPIAKYASNVFDWVINNSTKIFIVVGLLIVVIIGLWYINYRAEKLNKRAGKEISKAMSDLGINNLKEVKKEDISILEDLSNEYIKTKNGSIFTYKLGKYYYEKNNLKKAEKYFEKSLKNIENKDFVQLSLANLYLEKKEYNKSLTSLKNIPKKFVKYDNVLYLMYVNAKKLNKDKIIKNVKEEFKKDKYKKSQYYEMLKIREVL